MHTFAGGQPNGYAARPSLSADYVGRHFGDRSGVTRGWADRSGWHLQGGWQPSEINKSDSDEQKRSSVFFQKNRGDTLSCCPGCHSLVTRLGDQHSRPLSADKEDRRPTPAKSMALLVADKLCHTFGWYRSAMMVACRHPRRTARQCRPKMTSKWRQILSADNDGSCGAALRSESSIVKCDILLAPWWRFLCLRNAVRRVGARVTICVNYLFTLRTI